MAKARPSSELIKSMMMVTLLERDGLTPGSKVCKTFGTWNQVNHKVVQLELQITVNDFAVKFYIC